jgi:hypothetical protein
MILIIPFVNFAVNFFWVRWACTGLKTEHSWYVILGMTVFDLGKVTSTVNVMAPSSIFLMMVAGMAGSIIGRNEAVKRKTSGRRK